MQKKDETNIFPIWTELGTGQFSKVFIISAFPLVISYYAWNLFMFIVQVYEKKSKKAFSMLTPTRKQKPRGIILIGSCTKRPLFIGQGLTRKNW